MCSKWQGTRFQTRYIVELTKKYILQGPVSEHDSVEGQSSGDRVLLDKLHEGETRWLSLVSSHPHKLHISHLLEELQQLLCGGGLRKERWKRI